MKLTALTLFNKFFFFPKLNKIIIIILKPMPSKVNNVIVCDNGTGVSFIL